MGTRERLPLPFGDGIDRASGALVTDPTVFNDIRNVHLTRGRAELRKGLARALILPAPWTDLLGVYLIRAQGLAGAIAYNSVNRKVGLFAVDSSGAATAYISDLWTLPAGATSPPRISATDSYDQLIIAHDEPVYPLRQATQVYSAVEATVGPLMLDLARLGATSPVYFRGVQKHLAYIVGWGYGTNAADQGDRGEVLRISLPGQPTNFVPEHYFLVGTQGDPIIGCGPCGGELAVQKIASTKKLIGSDRASFGIRDLDPAYGLQSSRLHVSVNDEYHFWSLSGPRVTTGGASADLGLPLELVGVAPDALATATAAEDGFAYYDATEREIVYVFGQWGYVLHLKDGQRRWSYRPFAVALVNAGQLYVGGSLGLANITAHPEPGALAYVEPTYSGAGFGTPKITVPWTNVGGAGVTTESIEIWAKSSVAGSVWKRKHVGPATALTATISVDGFWTLYDIALRYTSGGFAAAGYVSADPANWPAVSRTTKLTEGTINTTIIGKWRRQDVTLQGFDITTYSGPGTFAPATLAGLTFRIEKSLDGFVTAGVLVATGVTFANLLTAVRFPNSDALLTYAIRIRVEGPSGNGAWFAIDSRVIAPEPPTTFAVANRTDPGGPGDGIDYHNGTWAAPAALPNGDVPVDGPFELRMQHFLAAYSGAFGSVVALGVGVHAYNYPVPDGVPNSTQYYVRAQVRTALAGGDVSAWITNLTGFDA